jgi:hypothetical protein
MHFENFTLFYDGYCFYILYCVIVRISVYFVVTFLEYIAIRILFRKYIKQMLHQNLGDIDLGALGDFNMIN